MFKITFLFIFLLTSFLHGANWLMLQGTQKKVGHNPWGFVQLRYENNEGDEFVGSDGKNKTPFSYIRPELKDQSQLQIARARLGLRGALDEDNKINYLLLTEFAQNGVNNPLGYSQDTYLIDSSLTFKQLPLYVRIGLFKYAGSEEGNMARFTSPFINFSTVGNQLMLERFVKHDGLSEPDRGVGAYRDTGIQLFQTYDITDKDSVTLSYMFGNGSGLEFESVNKTHYTNYAYLSYEHILGKGKGYKQESIKVYGWLQDGRRELEVNGVNKSYQRDRYGLGVTYFLNDLRLEAEWMKGKGMIVGGVKDTDINPSQESWQYVMNPDKSNEADGYYFLSTYKIFEPIELIARYDRYNRMTNNNATCREFKTITTGFSYIFKNYNRLDFNYAINSIEAPHNSVADDFLDDKVGNLLSIQLTLVFK